MRLNGYAKIETHKVARTRMVFESMIVTRYVFAMSGDWSDLVYTVDQPLEELGEVNNYSRNKASASL